MVGSFEWNANAHVGELKAFPRALVIPVVHEHEWFHKEDGTQSRKVWNSIVCFNSELRSRLESSLNKGDLVHFKGYVTTSTFTDDTDTTRRTVDLVVTSFDILIKHIEPIPSAKD